MVWEDVVVNTVYDIRGNVLKVYDPLGRVMVESVYNMGSSALKTIHIDAGEKTNITDCAGRPIEARDAKGALVLSIYDEGSRPTFAWARDKASEEVTLRGYTAYGDNSGLTDPQDDNLKGKVYQQYDEAGMSEMPLYDFKGNLLTNLRQFISDSELLSVFTPPPTDWEVECYRVDWTGVPSSPPTILDARVFETNSEYDALNRVTEVVYPEDTDSERKIGIPTYNKAGALESMEFNGDTYVNHIAYNAKGQRLLIAYGNTQMTRYVYDHLTFRLQRLRTEKYDQTGWTFDPDSALRQDYAYFYDLVGNIVQMNDRSPDCGIVGSILGDQALNRSFIYDPLYRLLTADGRENIPSSNYPWWDDSYRSDDTSTTSAYTQNYEYDKIGNILELAHTAASSPDSFTRTFDYGTTNNQLTGITVATSIGTYTYDYDEVGNQIKENTTRNYEWDHSNNMRCFFNQAGTSQPTIYAQYLYSGSQRVKKLVRTSGGGYESTCYVGGIYEYKTDGTDEQNMLHVQSIARIRTGDAMGDISPAIKYNLEDNLGSSMTLLDDTGNWVNREEYYPFGETSFGSYALKRYRFQGKEKDTESGLYYFGARYYCAANCRFISVDAVVQPVQSSYCGMDNNPIAKVDPDGNATLGVDPPDKKTSASSKLSGVSVKEKVKAPEVSAKVKNSAKGANTQGGQGGSSTDPIKITDNIVISGTPQMGTGQHTPQSYQQMAQDQGLPVDGHVISPAPSNEGKSFESSNTTETTPGENESFVGGVAHAIYDVAEYIYNNPAHAGYGQVEPITQDQLNRYGYGEGYWQTHVNLFKNTFDPMTVINNTSHDAVYGVGGLYNGISTGNGYQSAASIPLVVGTVGTATGSRPFYGFFNRHHVIPNAVYKTFKKELDAIGWNQNHPLNLKRLPVPFHGNHPAYNNMVEFKIRLLKGNGQLDLNNMIELQYNLRQEINDIYLDHPNVERLNHFYLDRGWGKK